MSLHIPEAARLKSKVDLNEDRDRLLADAFGEGDAWIEFRDDPAGWKNALHILIQDTDSEIAEINAELTGLRYANQRREPANRRSELVNQKAALINRLRFVKTLMPTQPQGHMTIEEYEGSKFEQAQAHIRAANRLLKEWAAEQIDAAGSVEAQEQQRP